MLVTVQHLSSGICLIVLRAAATCDALGMLHGLSGELVNLCPKNITNETE
jgi:hypothetical protein